MARTLDCHNGPSLLLSSCRLRPSSWTCSWRTCWRSSCLSVSCTSPILFSLSPFRRSSARPPHANGYKSLWVAPNGIRTVRIAYLWWRDARRPPRRLGSCEDSASSAICKRLAASTAPRVGPSWAASGWCCRCCNCHWNDTAHGSTTQNTVNSKPKATGTDVAGLIMWLWSFKVPIKWK